MRLNLKPEVLTGSSCTVISVDHGQSLERTWDTWDVSIEFGSVCVHRNEYLFLTGSF